MPKNEENLCNSREWWATIKEIAENFEKELAGIGEAAFIQLDIGKLKSALEMYEQSWHRLKIHAYGKKAKEELIDRHKIISCPP
jgi:hypothetical protein